MCLHNRSSYSTKTDLQLVVPTTQTLNTAGSPIPVTATPGKSMALAWLFVSQ